MALVRTVLLLVHLGVLLLAGATVLNAYIAPSTWALLNLLSLAFPVLLLLHIFLTLLWVLMLRKRAVVFALSTVLLINPIQRIVNWNSTSDQVESQLKVLTYNAKNGAYAEDSTGENLENYLAAQNADIVFLQETRLDEEKLYQHQHEVLAIRSKYPLENIRSLITDGSNSYAVSADISVKGTKIRLINIYLEPFQLKKTMVRPTRDVDTNKIKAKRLIARMLPVFRSHQEQVAMIQNTIESSPYPVLLGGDFNAVPNSYEYYHLSQSLVDPFVQVGRGLSTSFHDYKFPIRIDYLLTSQSITPRSYQVDRSIGISDHFPVIGYFSLP